MNNDAFKGFLGGIIVLAVIIYAASPIDFFPGPIDDILVAVIGLSARKKMLKGKSE